MQKTILSTRNPFLLWLTLLIPLGIVAAGIYYVVIVRPESAARQTAERTLAECRNQVSAGLWDDAEHACNDALRLAPSALAVEASQLLQNARNGWLAHHYTRGESLLAAGEPGLALTELELVFGKDPGYRSVGDLRRQAQIALTPTSTPTLRPGETPPTPTLTAIPTHTPVPTLDEIATSAAQATAVALAVAQTLEAQAEETRQADAIAATLTARAPTTTPTPVATATPRRAAIPTTRTHTPAPTPNRTATARARATSTAQARATETVQAQATATAEAFRNQGEVIDGPLNVRSGPGTSYSPVAQLRTNEQFKVLGRSADNNWLQIETNSGVIGWLAAGYVRTGQEVTRYPTRAAPPTPVDCAIAVDGGLASQWNRNELGCPLGPASTVWSAWQPFEQGHMIWRRDTDAAYVFYNSGGWLRSAERWNEGIAIRSRGAPPGGLQAPVRGFGYIWGLHDDIFQGLGWARDKEKGFCALIQEFDQGFILRSSTVSSCWNNLYNHATEPGFGLSFIKANTAGYWQ